jgi:hypothetical protein
MKERALAGLAAGLARIACPSGSLWQPGGASESERWQALGVGPQRN